MVEIFRPTGTVPHLSGNDTPALTWDFAYELNARPSPCIGSGPRIGRRKTRLTCGEVFTFSADLAEEDLIWNSPTG